MVLPVGFAPTVYRLSTDCFAAKLREESGMPPGSRTLLFGFGDQTVTPTCEACGGAGESCTRDLLLAEQALC